MKNVKDMPIKFTRFLVLTCTVKKKKINVYLQYLMLDLFARNWLPTDLPGCQDDGGQLGAVPPLGQEGESEGLQEDG